LVSVREEHAQFAYTVATGEAINDEDEKEAVST